MNSRDDSESKETTETRFELDELIALNEEIISLVQAGIPLELGLREMGNELPDRLGKISSQLADKMERGSTLSEAMETEGSRFPKVYRVIVEAGIKSGKLTVALEEMSNYAWELFHLRRQIGMAMVYPLIVFSLAYGLFLVFLFEMLARFNVAYDVFRLGEPKPLLVLNMLESTIVYWGLVPPLLLFVFVILWMRTGSSQLLNFKGTSRLIGWIPGVQKIANYYRYGNFSELMSLLIQQNIPFAESIVLAAEATGDDQLVKSANLMAERHLSSQFETGDSTKEYGWPPLLTWLLTTKNHQGELSLALKNAADMYRRKAANYTRWFRVLFPIFTGTIIGGGTVLCYSLVLFLPFSDMLKQLANP
ncbi:MAG: type II secretion system F family protein [Planctomycetaceae bacterium]|nr:type II secretion system F family protein [Planctomycetaceae bacterium]